ncbi:MAG: hypothetical protein U5L11_16440 [Arhodomonas sp.]|nr:hypothetical protein [Arhodomonas sp.]
MRVFMLAGVSGLHMLDSIQTQLREVSSERRFMPEPNFLERGPAAEVLTAAGTAEEEPDGLRQAEGLSIKRLSWSVLLHKAERLSVDLQPNQWSADRQKFYEFAQEHVLRPDRILSHWDTLPRLIGLATACEDDKQAALLVQRGVRRPSGT